jgi:hypothetical protein
LIVTFKAAKFVRYYLSIIVYYRCELTIKLVLHYLLIGKPKCIKRFNLNALLITI